MFRPFTFRKYEDHWREFDQLQREFNQIVNRLRPHNQYTTAPSYPAINVWTNESEAVVTAELPGMGGDELEISVIGDTVTLSGSRTAEPLPEDTKHHRRERGFGQFNRTFQLPFTLDADKVKARFQNGVLHLSLPRAEAEKPKKITVQTA